MFTGWGAVLFGAALVLPVTAGGAAERDPALIGHWPLAGDARDVSGNARHGRNHGVAFETETLAGRSVRTARFDGRAGWIEVPPGGWGLGTGDFTISVRVHTGENLRDVPGDLLSQYDPEARRGFNFGILSLPGSTSSQPNDRNIHFGIDDGRLETSWTDHGRPGNAIFIFGMAVHEGSLFVGTCEAGEDESGRVFRLGENGEWIDCGAPDGSNAVTSLAVWRGRLYVGTGKYRLQGSSLSESQNPRLGGRVFRYVRDGRWEDCGQVSEATEAVGGLVVFDGQLYASSLYAPAGLFRYEGGSRWSPLGSMDGKRPVSLTVHDGSIYTSSYDEGSVFEFDGTRFLHRGRLGDNTQTYGFVVHRGDLYAATWPSGRMYRYGGGDSWIDAGQLGEEREVMATALYNGKLYAGTLPLGKVFRYEGGTSWTDLGQIDTTPDVRYRRVWSMAVFRGRLFAGTLPAGKVLSIEAGRNATVDHPLASGWRHLAAVRRGDRLEVYVDGRQAAQSARFIPSHYDLTLDSPLRMGAGENDYFSGRMADVRLFGRALSAEEVLRLAAGR